MKSKAYRMLAGAVIAVAAGFLFLRPPALEAENAAHPQSASAEAADERPIVAAMFFSNFCSSCRVLEPRINHVRGDFDGRAVDFVVLNQTLSIIQSPQLDALAEEHGITQTWEHHRGSTGFMVLIDAATGEELEYITLRYSEDDIRDAIDRWLTSNAV